MGNILRPVEINASGGDATVYGNASVDGLIYSDQNTHVTAMAGSAADVIAELNVDLFAGGDSSGYVWAGNNADVTVTGTVSGDVTADIGNALVSANGSITSISDAGQQATVAALGPITGGSITAGASASVTTWAELGSTINAIQNADAWAYGAINGNITASGQKTGRKRAENGTGPIVFGTIIAVGMVSGGDGVLGWTRGGSRYCQYGRRLDPGCQGCDARTGEMANARRGGERCSA